MKRLKEIKRKKTVEEYLHDHYWQIGPALSKRQNERNAKRIAITIAKNTIIKTKSEFAKELAAKIAPAINSLDDTQIEFAIRDLQMARRWAISLPNRNSIAQPRKQTTAERIKDLQDGMLNLYKKGIILSAAVPSTPGQHEAVEVTMGPFILEDERDKTYKAEIPILKICIQIEPSFGPNGWTDNGGMVQMIMSANPINCAETEKPWISASYPHPHVSSGRICLGEAGPMIARAFAVGDIPSALQIVFNTLSTYNGSSPYKPLVTYIKPVLKRCARCAMETDAKQLVFIREAKPTEITPHGSHCRNCVKQALNKKNVYMSVPVEEAGASLEGEILDKQDFPDTLVYIDDNGYLRQWWHRKHITERRGFVTAYCKELQVNLTLPIADTYPVITAIDEEPVSGRQIATDAFLEIVNKWRSSNRSKSFTMHVLNPLRAGHTVEPKTNFYTEEAKGRAELLKKIADDLKTLAIEVEASQPKSSDAERNPNEGSEPQRQEAAVPTPGQ